jgi:hypothetical protein
MTSKSDGCPLFLERVGIHGSNPRGIFTFTSKNGQGGAALVFPAILPAKGWAAPSSFMK